MNKNILIMIDNQNGFVTTKETADVSKKIVDLSNSNIFDICIATQYFNNLESKTNLFTKLQKWYRLADEQEINYVDGLRYDYTLTKDVYGAVNQQMIDFLKKANDGILPEYVFLCGMDTECCVLKTCVDFFEIGIIPILLNNYSASNSGIEAHDIGIKQYNRLVSNKTLVNKDIMSKKDLSNLLKEMSI